MATSGGPPRPGFSLLRRRPPAATVLTPPGVDLTPAAAAAGAGGGGAGGAAAVPRLAADPPGPPDNNVLPDAALGRMLDALRHYLPAASGGLPPAGAVVVSVADKSVGLGALRGNDFRGPLGLVALRGGRLEALVRFSLWGNNSDEVDAAVRTLQSTLLASRIELQSVGFLRVTADGLAAAAQEPSTNDWRGTVDYRVLYEYHYEDSDEAKSLIARIDVARDLEHAHVPPQETGRITDSMVRWDNLITPAGGGFAEWPGAPTLVLRGPRQVQHIDSLAFVPVLPTGAITLLRTFDGAAGAPANHPTLAEFLSAVAGSAPTERHAQVSFPDLNAFLAVFAATSDPFTLGDWNVDGVLDVYQPRTLVLSPAIWLAHSTDRLEISYASAAFDQPAVVYLKA